MRYITKGKRNIDLGYDIPDNKVLKITDNTGTNPQFIVLGKRKVHLTSGLPEYIDVEMEDRPIQPANNDIMKVASAFDLGSEVNAIVQKQNAIKQAFAEILVFKEEIDRKLAEHELVINGQVSDIKEKQDTDKQETDATLITLSNGIELNRNDIQTIYGLVSMLEQRAGETEQGIQDVISVLNKHEHPKATKESVGLGKADNTSDIDKPISRATQEALDDKVSIEDFNAFAEQIVEIQKKQKDFQRGIDSLGGMGISTVNLEGGKKNQVLTKKSDQNGDYEWQDAQAITDIDASKITSGTLDNDRLDIIPYSKLDGVASSEQGELADTAIQPNDNVSSLVNDAGYITSADVGNATLTIQKNSTTIDTFTANASVDKTINITVPTQASDVSALPDSTKYGASLSLTINSSTYVITGQLKDQDGNNLGSAQTIDLPLESVVVSGSYDDATKKIILTLQNGSTIEFSVADLVSGLQSEITVSNKLDADLVDDSTSTNKFVTASDKTTWNGKQDAISDLNTIRSGASAGATALQPNASITGATKCKITYDSKGLVTAGADLSSSDITTALGYTPYNSTNPSGYQANVLEGVQVNGTDLTITGKKVNVPVPTTVAELSDSSDYALVSSLSTVATSGSYDDLLNKPTIPTVNNAKLTIKENGTSVGTFTANASTNKTVNITVPTTVAELTDSSNYVLSSSLATVATSGLYSDLTGTPTIPTVNDATLTIQKNGTTVDTFTANSSTNTTVNITVPTQASDIGALPDTTSIPANTSDLNNDSGFITGIDSTDVTTALGFTPADASSLATVATSGQYSDLTGTPTIPTVNNPTIKITQGGVEKGSFTLNQSSGDTIALDAGGGGGVWGSITGTLSDQTDLANALSGKYDASNPNGYTSNVGTVTSVNNTSPDGNGNVSLTIPDISNLADKDLSNLSQTGQDIIDGKVSKSGDTMTGALNISNSASQKFNIVGTDITKGTAPASDKYTVIQFNDSSNSSTWQNTRLGSVEHKLGADGSSRMYLGATQNVAASSTQAQIWVQESSSGVASCSFPNTDRVDGQWVYSQTAVASGISGTSSYSTDFDLSSYLPNDSYNYECLFVAGGGTSTSNGNTSRIWLKTAISGQSLVACATTRTSSRMYCAGCATVIIGTDRKVTLSLQNSGGTTSEVYFNLNAYRRVGKNG